ncbi:RDD family protein [Dinghuibacter silviterrae]|uniref:Putative RDD family membrane protein YckC n=1 Tax=Dinghuibacter silviterrae TaxID=1539049 RepID=A0A4V3GLU4_9BACT|nr:RDD family protein [Dinghuibacter silviterrae]TDX00923.1 putative RDD family membrane protein YckC [Dinghuibacter silviterrae]
MSTIRIPTSFNIDLEFDIPEFHRRLLALFIDWSLIFLFWLLTKAVTVAVLGRSDDMDTVMIAMEIAGIPILLYFLLSEIWMNGQSLGKKIMRIRVVNMNGGKPSLGQYFIRWLLRPVDFAITFCLGGLLSVIFSKYSQRLGDLAAGTILISTNARAGLEETVFMELAQDYVPQFPQVMRLSDRDLNTIRSLLERSKGSDNFHITATAAEKIKAVLHIDTPLEPYDFLETLLKDYNYISVQ